MYLHEDMCTWVQVTSETRDTGSLEPELQAAVSSWHGYWESNSSPLQEQYLLSSTESSPQSLKSLLAKSTTPEWNIVLQWTWLSFLGKGHKRRPGEIERNSLKVWSKSRVREGEVTSCSGQLRSLLVPFTLLCHSHPLSIHRASLAKTSIWSTSIHCRVTAQWYSACLGVSGFYPSSRNKYIIKNEQINKARDVTELVECFPSILEALGLIPSCIKLTWYHTPVISYSRGKRMRT